MLSQRNSGFSLIELLVVLAIIGIISAIAIPSYQNSVTKTRRAEGKSLLLEIAQAQERNFTQYNQYAVNITVNTPPTSILMPVASDHGYYTVAISNATTNAYTLTVAPQAPHVDPECGSLTLTHLGLEGITGTGTTADCW